MSIITKLYELDKKAIDFGFSWTNSKLLLNQIISECEEVREVIDKHESKTRLQEEVADILEATLKLCVFLKLDPYLLAANATHKFEHRFKILQQLVKEVGYENLIGQPQELLLSFWQQAKARELPPYSFSSTPLHLENIATITKAFSLIGWNKPPSLYEKYLHEQQNGERFIWLAWDKEEFMGYVTLLIHSEYTSFRTDKIPEIVDLNVLPNYRERGVATYLLGLAENKASEYSNLVGICVGLTADYGNAQKLYVNMGYTPEGKGIIYDGRSLEYGSKVTLDDELVLPMTKIVY
jgi:GNAT superfamily N-acetyltransferase/NTP pyrophosphatase (non-canonical NTP hydrolase)